MFQLGHAALVLRPSAVQRRLLDVQLLLACGELSLPVSDLLPGCVHLGLGILQGLPGVRKLPGCLAAPFLQLSPGICQRLALLVHCGLSVPKLRFRFVHNLLPAGPASLVLYLFQGVHSSVCQRGIAVCKGNLPGSVCHPHIDFRKDIHTEGVRIHSDKAADLTVPDGAAAPPKRNIEGAVPYPHDLKGVCCQAVLQRILTSGGEGNDVSHPVA